MSNITKNEKRILKCFLKLNEPKFVSDLGLKYDMDYYYGTINKIIKNVDSNKILLEDYEKTIKEAILKYIENYGNYDDIIYYHFMEISYAIFCKYCE